MHSHCLCHALLFELGQCFQGSLINYKVYVNTHSNINGTTKETTSTGTKIEIWIVKFHMIPIIEFMFWIKTYTFVLCTRNDAVVI